MGLFVKLGVVGELNHKTVCSFHSIYHLIVSRTCYLQEAPAYNHWAFSTTPHSDQSWSRVTLNERVDETANIRDWLKEESEWR